MKIEIKSKVGFGKIQKELSNKLEIGKRRMTKSGDFFKWAYSVDPSNTIDNTIILRFLKVAIVGSYAAWKTANEREIIDNKA